MQSQEQEKRMQSQEQEKRMEGVYYSAKQWGSHPDAENDDWKREQAMEAGMLYGIDAYNDMMGY